MHSPILPFIPFPLPVQDDADRENEGDIIGAAACVDAAAIAALLRVCTGVVCVAVPAARGEALGLSPMVPNNRDPYKTAFTVTVDYVHGTSTGISASDRAATVRALGDESCTGSDFTAPGHVFPLTAKDGGVLVRGGHTEATMDLCRLAGFASGVGYLCEVCETDTVASLLKATPPATAGTAASPAAISELAAGSYEMLRFGALQQLAQRLRLPLITIADLQRYRMRREVLVRPLPASVSPALHAQQTSTRTWAGAGLVSQLFSFRGIYSDLSVDVTVWTGERGATIGSDSRVESAATVPLLVQFEVDGLTQAELGHELSLALATPSEDGSALAAKGLAAITVWVSGRDLADNVRGKESVQLSSTARQRSSVEASHAASAYDGASQRPAGLVALPADPQGTNARGPLCDRALAEASQCIYAAMTAATSCLAGTLPSVTPMEERGVQSCRPIKLVGQSAASLGSLRLWEWGLPVTEVALL